MNKPNPAHVKSVLRFLTLAYGEKSSIGDLKYLEFQPQKNGDVMIDDAGRYGWGQQVVMKYSYILDEGMTQRDVINLMKSRKAKEITYAWCLDYENNKGVMEEA